MAKGYWVGRVDVRDAQAYQQYVVANAAALRPSANTALAFSFAAASSRRLRARADSATS